MWLLQYAARLKNRNVAVRFLLLVLALLLVAGTSAYVLSAKKSTDETFNRIQASRESYGSALKVIFSRNQEEPATEDSQSETNQTTPANPYANLPFTISKVLFTEAPKVPSGAGPDQCTIGQEFQFQATAQLSASNKGTAKYHWEVIEYFGDGVEVFPTESIPLTAAGTKKISKTFSYKVYQTNHPNGRNNRLYINLVVTSPNTIYANMEQPVYANNILKTGARQSFVWGTYIDLC